jgi:hypothetical protein
MALMASCSRKPAPAPAPASQQSLEERIADLEKSVGGGSPRPSEEEVRKEEEHDLAEIRSLGLVDRAQRDFGSRVPGAVIENFRISYFMDTNVVWCGVVYHTPGGGDSRSQDFGYKRASGTNWNLIWNDASQH